MHDSKPIPNNGYYFVFDTTSFQFFMSLHLKCYIILIRKHFGFSNSKFDAENCFKILPTEYVQESLFFHSKKVSNVTSNDNLKS